MTSLRDTLQDVVRHAQEVQAEQTEEQIEKRIAAYLRATGVVCITCQDHGTVPKAEWHVADAMGQPYVDVKTGERRPMKLLTQEVCPDCHGQRETPEQAYRRRVEQSGIPEPMWSWGLSTFPIRRQPSMEPVLRQVQAWAEHPHGGLVLTGGTGVGKSSLAAGAALRCIEQGLRVRWWETVRLQEALRAAIPNGDYQGLLDREVHGPTVLILDDFGTEQGNEFPHVVEQIITRRYAEERAFIVTMNLTPEQFEKQVPRLFSRFNDESRVSLLACRGNDLRR